MDFIVIIPARFCSKRFPGKPLADINGKPMVVHVMEKARISGANRIIVATDNNIIAKIVSSVGGEVCLTSSDHQSGIERIQEVIDKCNLPNDCIIVNLQVDEPLIPPEIIYKVAKNLNNIDVGISTLATPIINVEEASNSNIVKVVIDAYGYALYFSRALIPWHKKKITYNHKYDNPILLRHIGIYAYRANFVHRYVNWLDSPLERTENLEQLRILWHGEKIHVGIINKICSISVDTPEDLVQVRILQEQL